MNRMFRPTLMFLGLVLLFCMASYLVAGWEFGSPMPTARYGLAAAELDSFIYVIGGKDENGVPTAVVERYDPENDQWDSGVAPITSPRYNAAAVSLLGKIYLIGGMDESGIVGTIEEYDPAFDQWSVVDTLPEPRQGLAAVTLGDTIYIIAGWGDQNYLCSVLMYIPGMYISPWSMDNLSLSRVGLAATTWNNRIYAIGGVFFGPLSLVEEYWAYQHYWTTIDSLGVPRGWLAAATIGDTIYAIGGFDGNNSLAVVECYLPSADSSWFQIDPMQMPRDALAAVSFNGKIYAFGGSYRQDSQVVEVLEVVEVYEPGLAVIGSVDDNQPTLIGFQLSQNYPNPFNTSTIIRFGVPAGATGRIRLTIYNIRGQEITRLVNAPLAQGNYSAVWDGQDEQGNPVSGGLYFYVLECGLFENARSMLYLP
ncbi:hypothetical protein ISS37_04890 [candidate division KSB1 bacterium]|nr:hypothetical protein [candidate division KSB1 bacterium]